MKELNLKSYLENASNKLGIKLPKNKNFQYFDHSGCYKEWAVSLKETPIGTFQLWTSYGYHAKSGSGPFLYVGVEIDKYLYKLKSEWKNEVEGVIKNHEIWYEPVYASYWFGIYQGEEESTDAFLAVAASFIKAVSSKAVTIKRLIDAPPFDFSKIKETEKLAIIKQRIQQSKFRKDILALYGNKCLITGIEAPELLVASHIKAWSECSHAERLDECNGFPLLPNYDKLFDSYLMCISDDGTIKYAKEIEHLVKPLKLRVGKSALKPNLGCEKYLKCHKKQFEESQS